MESNKPVQYKPLNTEQYHYADSIAALSLISQLRYHHEIKKNSQ